MTAPADANRHYYGALYRRRSGVLAWLLTKLSYDQRSKTKRNLRLLARHAGPARGQDLAVLDFGCGRGTFLRALPWRPLTLYGVELVPEALATLSRLPWGSQRRFIPCPDGLETPALQGALDIACASHILEHVEDADAALEALVGTLRPGGLLLINVPVNEVFDDPRHVRAYREDPASFAHPRLELLGQESGDRWSAFLLSEEYGSRPPAAAKRLFLRALRALLALLPLAVLERSERWLLPARYRPSQFLVLARKTHG